MTNDNRRTKKYPDDHSEWPRTDRVRVLDARELFGECNEVRVLHCNEEYRLMLTRNNKLILTK
ncbi:MAG: hemin uptake protein HemP [Planctomycetota bacterium]